VKRKITTNIFPNFSLLTGSVASIIMKRCEKIRKLSTTGETSISKKSNDTSLDENSKCLKIVIVKEKKSSKKRYIPS
jgi:hypothetical protein